MTTIQSEKVLFTKSAEDVFNFLADANNHEQLMPSNITNWSSTADDCSFSIQNMGTLQLTFSERKSPNFIKITPVGKVPFTINLQWDIEATDTGCTAQLTVHADLNPFIKMVAVGPLTTLVNHQVQQLQKAV